MLDVRSLTTDDLASVVDLDRLALGGLWSADAYQREFDSDCSDVIGAFMPASKGESVAPRPTSDPSPTLVAIGCAWAILDECHITLVAVHPAVRRQGLGRRIVWELLAAAHRRGLARATLEVRSSNHAARSLYAQFGFTVAGTRQRYYPDGEDAAILWRSRLDWPQFAEELAAWEVQ